MFSKTPEKKMLLVRAALAAGWILLIISLFFDPLTPELTRPENLKSPFRLRGQLIEVQGVPVGEKPYAMGARIFWSMILPLIPLSLMVFGHETWRRVCPLSFFTQVPRHLGIQYHQKIFNRRSGAIEQKLNLIKTGSWIRQNFWYVQFGLLFLGVTFRLLFINSDRVSLGIFFITVILAAMTVGFFWGGKTWCNYLCPISVVQKIYSEPRGLLESQAHLQKQPISQSMCRTSTKNGDQSICVGCISPCPDIDLERAYWEGIENPGRRFVYYGYFGLVLSFYTYYFLYSGNWEYYFSGVWTREETQLSQLFNPGFYVFNTPIPIPKLIAAPLTIGASIFIVFGLGCLLEKLYERVRNKIGKPISIKELRHHCFIFSAFITINTFYLFAGRPNIRLLPESVQALLNAAIVFLTTIWLWRSLQRVPDEYNRESVVSSLLKQLKKLNFDFSKVLEGRSLDDLKTDEVYILAKTLPGFTREQKYGVYKNVLQEALATGKTDSANSLALLKEVRLQVGLNEDEHNAILKELHVESDHLLDPEEKITQENWIRLNNYRKSLEQIIMKAVAGGIPLAHIWEQKATLEELNSLRSFYQVSESQHQEFLSQLLGTGSVFIEQANKILHTVKELTAQHYSLSYQALDVNSGLFKVLCKIIVAKRRLYSTHLLNILSSVGDSDKAVMIAQNLFILMGDEVEEVIKNRATVNGENVDWEGRLGPKVLDALRRILEPEEWPNLKSEQETAQDPSQAIPAQYSYSDVILSARDPLKILEALIDDIDPITQAIALAALGNLKMAAAREKARKLKESNKADHWLLKETVESLLGNKAQDEVLFSDQKILKIVIKFFGEAPVSKVFNKPVITIGQAAGNDVVIYGQNISPQHALIRRNASSVFVEDLNSLSGTIVNDVPLFGETRQLRKGDKLRFDSASRSGPSLTIDWEDTSSNGTDNYLMQLCDTLTKFMWLADVELFSHLELSILADLARDAEVRVYPKGSTLCRAGDPSEEIFVLRSGAAEAIMTKNEKDQVLGTISEGQLIGELGVITHSPRTATVRFISQKAIVLSIKGKSLDNLLEKDARVSKGILFMIYNYLQRAFSRISMENDRMAEG